MPYVKETLISRAGYSGVGGTWDDIWGGLESALKFYSSGQRAQGAADQANKDLQEALKNRGGISTETLLIGGAAVVIAGLLIYRRKS